MVRQSFVAVAVLLMSSVLPSCATVIEDPVQDLRIDIVGTGEALCDLTQPGRRYRAYAPGTIRVVKSDDPLKVTCAAPGNRALSAVLTPKMSPMLAANIVNGVIPGVTWDYLTGAAHHYPDRVVMDFSSLPPQAYDLPDYQKVIAQNPSITGMEQFRPGKAALIGDIGQKTPELPMREFTGGDSADIITIDSPPSDSPAAPSSTPSADDDK